MPNPKPKSRWRATSESLKSDLTSLLAKVETAVERIELEPDQPCHLEPILMALATAVTTSQRHARQLAQAAAEGSLNR